jgi:D-3-phosphoglycerate dehydrogenase
VVVTDCDHGTMAPEAAVLDAAGAPWRLEQCRTAADVIERAADATVLLNQYAPITGEVLDALPGVRLVVRYGVGVDNVDVAAAAERGVWVANVPDYGTEEVADHAVARRPSAWTSSVSTRSRAGPSPAAASAGCRWTSWPPPAT